VSVDLKQQLRAELALPLRAFIVVYVGRLVPEKHVDSLLGIWDDVRMKLPTAHLLIVGGGPDEQTLREMPVNGVQFTGPVNDAVRYMQASDLFVLPSSTEGLSNSLLEAMSTGLPVLATTVGGTNDVVQHQENGYLIPPDDVESLKAGLETLIDDDALRFRIGANARQRILRDFSLDSVAERLAALYQELLATRDIH
jgi:glycosyltransferase involved in cell wall biosynthesis